ncbi:hypothetical protein [Paenibacillus sp. BIHB 4019]|uniref:hypothetical protein n=1 Tax=Paenibacillus sp. BIHB 4019 TaxID=1870819 RepID=UPI0012375630|nr:hypothetical protein [Paenibacillus sp. BIHB 4019]
MHKNIAWSNALSIYHQIAYLGTSKQVIRKLDLSESSTAPETLDPVMLPLPDNASDMSWSPMQNQIVYTTDAQPSGNEFRVINVPDELLQ